MNRSATSVRGRSYGAYAACALGGVVAAIIAIPPADAAPPCSAGAFSSTASGVLAAASGYLDAHPDADDVLSSAGMKGAGAEQSVRDYFVAHPDQLGDLKGIAQPLIDMQHSCGAAIQPMQIAALYQALAGT